MMNKPQELQPGATPSPGHHRMIAPSLASAVVLLAAIGLSREMLMHEPQTSHFAPARHRVAGELFKGPESASPVDLFTDEASLQDAEQRRQEAKEADLLQPGGSRTGHAEPSPEFEFGRKDRDRRKRAESQSEAEFVAEIAAAAQASAPHKRDEKHLLESSLTTGLALETPAEEVLRSQHWRKAGSDDSTDKLFALANKPGDAPASREYDEIAQSNEIATGKTASRKNKRPKAELVEPGITKPRITEQEVFDGAGSFANNSFDFLGHYQQTENLYFQPATGYWANTYIPGDPQIRLLNARLAQSDRSWLENNAPLEQEIEPVKQPFDAPADNALALSLMADASSVSATDQAQGPTRMRLQVGIQGIEHRRGQRPAMNVGVVVDLPADAPDDVRIATRALLDAMLQSKQAGDRFSLVMTGQKGTTRGLVVPVQDFRFGSLQMAKQLILGQDSSAADMVSERSGPDLGNLDLYGAMERAGAMVQQTDDPGRPLGSSSVMLISAREIQDLERLTALAHERAREGITLSVIPLGSQPENSKIEKLVLAGLGNRRYLEAPGQARQLIEEELHASSRAVARAARLSIRLAPGVRLLEVVGSERLDVKQSRRVREIETSMDRRLSANLGIQADRGEDEDGIQIVIPSIFSGDSVTVLLDVVTDRPGAIADVSLRYKDLVFLRNGSLRGHLDLPAGQLSGGEPARGPAELAVLKNLLAHHFSDAVEQASTALGRQQPADAVAALSAMNMTIHQARRTLTAWANDPDLIRDQQVLERYIAALASPQAGAHQPFLADSLRYAAWAKTHRPLREWQ